MKNKKMKRDRTFEDVLVDWEFNKHQKKVLDAQASSLRQEAIELGRKRFLERLVECAPEGIIKSTVSKLTELRSIQGVIQAWIFGEDGLKICFNSSTKSFVGSLIDDDVEILLCKKKLEDYAETMYWLKYECPIRDQFREEIVKNVRALN